MYNMGQGGGFQPEESVWDRLKQFIQTPEGNAYLQSFGGQLAQAGQWQATPVSGPGAVSQAMTAGQAGVKQYGEDQWTSAQRKYQQMQMGDEQRRSQALQEIERRRASGMDVPQELWDTAYPDLAAQRQFAPQAEAKYTEVYNPATGQMEYAPVGENLIGMPSEAPQQQPGQTRLLNPEEVTQAGYRPGTVVQVDPTGKQTVVQTPESTTAQKPSADMEKRQTGLKLFEEALKDYEAQITKQGGGLLLPGRGKDIQQTAHTDLMLQAKELQNLGVLNGPDLDIIQSMIKDPSGIISNVREMFGGTPIKNNIDAIKKLLESRKRALGMSVSGGTVRYEDLQ